MGVLYNLGVPIMGVFPIHILAIFIFFLCGYLGKVNTVVNISYGHYWYVCVMVIISMYVFCKGMCDCGMGES